MKLERRYILIAIQILTAINLKAQVLDPPLGTLDTYVEKTENINLIGAIKSENNENNPIEIVINTNNKNINFSEIYNDDEYSTRDNYKIYI